MAKKIGFIGCGNMGSSILSGILDAGLYDKSDVLVSCRSESSKDRITEEFGVAIVGNADVAKKCDVIFLAVKPNVFPEVIPEVSKAIPENKMPLIISIAAGMTISKIEEMFSSNSLFGRDIKLIRSMPNTPALVGEAMSALCVNANVTDEDKELALKIFESFGQAEFVDEKLMDAVIGVSGSSPAYIYMLIEAMADGAVLAGMPRSQAYKFAAQSVLGSAKMVLETNIHPGELKDAVCSPGGTTIEGVAALERQGFRDAIIAAEKACIDKSIEMSRQ